MQSAEYQNVKTLHSELLTLHFVLPLCLSSYGAGFVNPYDGRLPRLGASPTRGSSLRSEPASGWIEAKDALYGL